MLTNFVKSLIILSATGFMANSYAAWNWNRNVTNCYGNHCKHVVVHKHCNNGRCWDYKHYNTWNR